MISLTWNEVCAWRLSQQFLREGAKPEQLAQVVSQMCGAQAQVMSAAELSVAARIPGLKSDAVSAALWQERTLVKSWLMRGTLHLIPANDYPLYVAASSTFQHFRRDSWLRYFDVTMEELEAIFSGTHEVLSDTGMTREQLADTIAKRTNKPKLREHLLSGWGTLLKPASYQGFLCFGPNQGQNVTFVNPDKWIGSWEPVDSNEAFATIARRFLMAFGPATSDGFARWFGLALSRARKVFKALGDEIVPVDVEGWQAMALTTQLEQPLPDNPQPIVRLLPHFDPYTFTIARHSTYLLPDEHTALVYRPQGWIMPVVLVDGRIAGVWEQETRKGQTTVTIRLFQTPDSAIQSGIEAEVTRLGQFTATQTELIYV